MREEIVISYRSQALCGNIVWPGRVAIIQLVQKKGIGEGFAREGWVRKKSSFHCLLLLVDRDGSHEISVKLKS